MPFSTLAIIGPTASGKSNLSLQIAESLAESGIEAEILNADAMQLYRGLDIGTAKLSREDRRGVTHHLFDEISPSEEMTAVEYSLLAKAKSQEVIQAGKLPIFVGGSMFYLSAALDKLDFAPTDSDVRQRLELEAAAVGNLEMHRRLESIDIVAANQIHFRNLRKVVRALEVIELTGQPFSASLPEQQYVVPTLTIGIDVERPVLKERIERRVNGMWAQGLLEEAEGLLASPRPLSKTARAAIGYQQAFDYLQGTSGQQEAIDTTIQLTNRYARRQMSWFRRDKRIHWTADSPELLARSLERIRLER
ncbi:MAG: tRNA (adenosine(37)-N6)-dimethylallyltransferase MiaA [Aquiluna sp.]|nr:tRNA (adenosine(37)-N6)-dimethylallyltransferase MiaA [Aquiluna sp.]